MEYSANDFRYYHENSLSHHGILGMKWGIRRYQNEDGTLTAAGRKRYGVDRNLEDKSLTNAAKIRKGEALRRLDYAKQHDPTNSRRIMELQGRVNSAKRAQKEARSLERGQKLRAKGQTVMGNNIRASIGFVASYLGSRAMTSFLNQRMTALQNEGRWTPAHTLVAQKINNAVGYTLQGGAALYYGKKLFDNAAIRKSYLTYASNRTIGSTEYRDVIERSKKK